MRPTELVVAIRAKDEARHRLDSSAERPEHVEGRLVGPVKVLQHEDGPRGRELVAHGLEDLAATRGPLEQLHPVGRSSVKRRPREVLSGRGVKSGSQGTFENALRKAGLRREHADERRLANACFTRQRRRVARARSVLRER